MTYLETLMPRITKWKLLAEPEHAYMTVNNSSWHMKVFPNFHKYISEVLHDLSEEKKDPMAYSHISCIWDLRKDKAIFVWHELDELPEPSFWDGMKYIREKTDAMAKSEYIKQESARLKREHEAAVAHEKSQENDYKTYVLACIQKEETPIDFVQFRENADKKLSQEAV